MRQPFLKLVPIVLGTSRFEPLEALGIALADVCRTRDGRPLIVASSDMNHYESDAITRRKDQIAIDRVLALDARGLHDVVMNEDISMRIRSGVAMITAAKHLGATQAELVGTQRRAMFLEIAIAWSIYAGIVVRRVFLPMRCDRRQNSRFLALLGMTKSLGGITVK